MMEWLEILLISFLYCWTLAFLKSMWKDYIEMRMKIAILTPVSVSTAQQQQQQHASYPPSFQAGN